MAKIYIEYPTLVKYVFFFVFFMIETVFLNITSRGTVCVFSAMNINLVIVESYIKRSDSLGGNILL